MNDIEELMKRLKECSTWHEDSKKLYEYIYYLQDKVYEYEKFIDSDEEIIKGLVDKIKRLEGDKE